MIRTLILSIIIVTIAVQSNGQNIFFLGENSYPSTETYTLQSNSESEHSNDLNILFAKEGAHGLIIASIKLVSTVRINGKLIIYLEDGTVITCIDRGIKDNVDDIASTAYYLTNEELNKMKKSNIHTIRYVIKCFECFGPIPSEGNYTASNTGSLKTDFPAIITAFYNNQ